MDVSEGNSTAARMIAEEQFRLLVDGVTDYAIFLVDSAGNILTWNIGAERIHGYTADEVIGKNVAMFYSTEARRNGKPELALRIADQEQRYEEEEIRFHKDGSEFLANAVITPIMDKGGSLHGFAHVIRDVTERRRALRDRWIGAALKSTLMPPFSAPPGLDVAVHHEASLFENRVGGDFYTAFALEGTQYVLAVGDVSGKGVEAASQVVTIQKVLRYAIHACESLKVAITHMNEIVTAHGLITGFVTLFVAIYDTRTRTINYISCGHEPGLLRRVSGEIEELSSTGIPIGVADEAQYLERVVRLGIGDILLLYTDGLSEAGPDRAHLLEQAGLTRILSNSAATDAASFVEGLLDAVKMPGHIGFQDDVCIMAVVAVDGDE